MLKLTATWRRVQLFCSFKGRVSVQNPCKYHSVWKHREMRSTACTNMDTHTQRDAAFLWIWRIIMIHLLSVKSIYSVLSHCNTFTLLSQICLIVFRGYFCCCFLLWILSSMWFSFHFRKMTLFFIFLEIVIVETLNNISCADLKSETNEEKCFRSSGERDCDSTCCKKKSDNIKIYGLFIC